MTLKECYDCMNGSYEDAKLRLMMDSMVERFMFKFLEDDTMANLRDAVAEKNIPDSFRAAHTLKGVAANLAFTELQAKASALTEQLRPQTAQADAMLLADVEKAYARVVDTINAYKAENNRIFCPR